MTHDDSDAESRSRREAASSTGLGVVCNWSKSFGGPKHPPAPVGWYALPSSLRHSVMVSVAIAYIAGALYLLLLLDSCATKALAHLTPVGFATQPVWRVSTHASAYYDDVQN